MENQPFSYTVPCRSQALSSSTPTQGSVPTSGSALFPTTARNPRLPPGWPQTPQGSELGASVHASEGQGLWVITEVPAGSSSAHDIFPRSHPSLRARPSLRHSGFSMHCLPFESCCSASARPKLVFKLNTRPPTGKTAISSQVVSLAPPTARADSPRCLFPRWASCISLP